MFSAPVPADRYLQLSSGSASVTFQDQYGEPQTASSGSVVASAFTSDGTTIFTSRSVVSGSTGAYAVHMNASDVANLDLLTLKWYDGITLRETTKLEVVGGFYFTVAEVRAADPTLTDATAYPAATIQRYRSIVEWEAERIMGVAWVPRYRFVVLDRPSRIDRPELLLPDPLVRALRLVRAYTGPSSTVDYTSGTSFTDLSAGEPGVLVSRSGAWSWVNVAAPYRSVTLGYEHGFDAPAPDVKNAAILHLRHLINRRTAALSDRATTQTNEFGNVNLATAGRDGFETGIPDVDAVYARHSYRTPGIG